MGGVVIGDPVAEGGRPLAGGHPLGGREEILDPDRDAAERPRVAGADGIRLGQGALRAQSHEGVQPGVQAVDRGKRHLDQLSGRELAPSHQRSLLHRAQMEDVVARHAQNLPAIAVAAGWGPLAAIPRGT